MKYRTVFFTGLVVCALGFGPPFARAQDSDEIEITDEDLDTELESDTSADNADVDDFDEFDGQDEKAQSQPQPESQEPTDEMTLEPLQGDEDQVSPSPTEEPALEAAPEVPNEPTLEAAPEPPPAAEPPNEAAPPPAVAEDNPDLDMEARLYDIYVNYNSKKMTSEEWSQLIGARESETYRIQRGDTLWAISKTFFNDGNYWPKIWQLNSSITNPHLIQPGHTIRFLLGTESETPAFSVTEETEQPVEMPVGEAGAMEAQPLEAAMDTGGSVEGAPTDAVEIPEATFYPPVLKKIPPSIPETVYRSESIEYDDTGINFVRRPILDLSDKKFLESFVDEEELKADGTVREIEGGGIGASNFQYIFVELPSGEGKVGEDYMVVEKNGRLPRVSREIATVQLGYQYHIRGQVRLADHLSTMPNGREIYRAMVTRSLGRIVPGTMVLHSRLPTLSVAPSGERKDVLTQIVGGHVIDGQLTLALHNLAYLSAGANQGLEPGQILTVRANTRLRNPDSIITESYIPVGQIKIVRVGQKFSTAIVTKVWDQILVGDVTGEGKVVPPEPPERRKQTANKEDEIILQEEDRPNGGNNGRGTRKTRR